MSQQKPLKMKFELPALPYAYSALEPFIDEATMREHHLCHHKTYVEKLNLAVEKEQAYIDSSLLSICIHIKEDEKDTKKNLRMIRENAGGHYNHSFFWTVMAKNNKMMRDSLKIALDKNFGNFPEFKKEFLKAASEVFGSGWVWLCYDPRNRSLSIEKSKDQENPMMQDKCLCPILALDVWEHAYYLKYKSKRGTYVEAWWNVINWHVVSFLYDKAVDTKMPVEVNRDGEIEIK